LTPKGWSTYRRLEDRSERLAEGILQPLSERQRDRLIAALALAAGSVGIAGVAYAKVIDVEIGTAPPPARVEVVPAPREGYLYEKGHYETSDGQTYVWVEGKYIPNR